MARCMSSVMVMPTEVMQAAARAVTQARKSWVPPPESVRISTPGAPGGATGRAPAEPITVDRLRSERRIQRLHDE